MSSKTERVPVPRRDPLQRGRDFSEVVIGYDADDAMREASRCLQCEKRPCVQGCPVEIEIPEFIGLIKRGDPRRAALKIREKNALPAVCGRVCPQEQQCEKHCVLGKKGDPVAIGKLERFAADSLEGIDYEDSGKPSTGVRVAVIGAGPAGLTASADLARAGYSVTLFEALHAAGGVLIYGIPEFRLPKSIVEDEVRYIERLGVEIVTDFVCGATAKLEDLRAHGYRAFFIAIGAGLPMFMNIPGENLNGVYSANEYLSRSNLMKAYMFPEYDTPIKRGRRVAVIGGGNVALDSARTALRLGAEEVHIIYRRSRKEMPARAEELENAEEEGIIFDYLTLPVEISGKNGYASEITCKRMELGAPDESGRRSPIPIEGSDFAFGADQIIVAIGAGPNPLLPNAVKGLRLNKRGYIAVNPENLQSSVPDVFAGGDIVTGSATVIEAMGAGKLAARSIGAFLKG